MRTAIAITFLLACCSSYGQLRSVFSFSTLTNLISIDPKAYSEAGSGSALVLGRYAEGDWGDPKTWVYSRSSSASTSQWVVVPASGVGRLFTVQTNSAGGSGSDLLTSDNLFSGSQQFSGSVEFLGPVTIDAASVAELTVTNLIIQGVTLDPSIVQNDFDVVEEYVGPTGYSLFVGTANGGAAASGTSAVTLTNLLGMSYISTSGSNQYPQNLLSAPFINSGMSYVQLRTRFRVPLASTDADVFEWQVGIFDLGTTTNRPKAGAWITVNTNFGNANVWLCNGTNSTYNLVDTGVPFTNAAWSSWAVRLTPSNSVAFCGTNAVATNSASYPTSTFLPSWGGRVSRYLHTGGATRFMLFDRQQATFVSGPGR